MLFRSLMLGCHVAVETHAWVAVAVETHSWVTVAVETHAWVAGGRGD